MKLIFAFSLNILSIMFFKDSYTKYIDKNVLSYKWSHNTKYVLVFKKHILLKDGNVLKFEIKNNVNETICNGQFSDFPSQYYYENKTNYLKIINYKCSTDNSLRNNLSTLTDFDMSLFEKVIIKNDSLFFTHEKRSIVFVKLLK